MSGSTMADRRPVYLMQPSTSGFEYACTDCSRTFRRHATYRRHRQLSHDDDVTAPPSYHFQTPLRQINATSCVSIDDVMIDMETVENCCVDNEIHLGENSNGVSDKSEILVREQHEKHSNGTDSVKIKMEDDDVAEGDGELADFRSTPPEAHMDVYSRQQQRRNFNESPRPKASATALLSKSEFTSVRHLPPQPRTTNQQQWHTIETNHLQLSASTCKPEMDVKQRYQMRDLKPEVSQASFAVSSGSTLSTAPNTTQKIFVYVKTEPQASCTSAVKMLSDEQPMISAASVKPSGCQFLCPICQRLFNSEKYLSMHMSSIHRAPDNAVQTPHHLQPPQHLHPNGKHGAPLEVVSSSTWHPSTSSIVAAVAMTTPRRMLSSNCSIVRPPTLSHVTTPVTITASRQIPSMTSSASTVLPSVITVQAVASAGGAGGSKPPPPLLQASNSLGAPSGPAQNGPSRSASSQWTCNICNKSFAQNSSYKNHIRTHSDDRPYVCSICSIGFKERYHLKKHALFKHTTELNETCRVCGKRFKDSTAVRAHERIHSDLRPYGCTLCGKTFKTSECLWHHENRSKTCGKMAVAAAAMSSGTMVDVEGRSVARRHVAQQQDSRTISATGPRRQRRSPMSGTVPITKQLPTISREPSGSFNVIHSAITSISGRLTNNETKSTVSGTAAASTSSVAFNSPAFTAIGMTTRIADVAVSTAQSSKCVFAISSSESPLINGRRDSVDDELAPIDDCIDSELLDDVGLASIFDRSVDDEVGSAVLVEDFWQHFDVDQMTSDYCDIYSAGPDVIDSISSSTETASSSDDSEVSGLTIEDFTKDINLKPINLASTSSSSSLSSSDVTSISKMVSVGGGNKRHDCFRCDKRFASATTLEKHLLVHAEVRPYRCSVCDIGFKLKVHLKKHNLYRHSDDYPCECSVCGKRFKDSSAVRLHERIHSTDRPFQCLHCGKSFKTKENLWGHRNRGPCDKSYSPMTVDASPSSVGSETGSSSETNDVSQHFVANNIRLFHSAEFGPILGVPVNARLVLRDAADDASDESHCRKADSNGGQPLVMTASSSTLPRLSVAQDGGSGSQRVFVSMSAAPMFLQNAVPTAVVAPIKRQSEAAVNLSSSSRPSSLVLPSPVRLMTSDDHMPAANVAGRRQLLPVSAFQQLSSGIRKRSNSASVADRCPTVQKYLAFGAAVSTSSPVHEVFNTSKSSSSRSELMANVGDVPNGSSHSVSNKSSPSTFADSVDDVTTSVLLDDGPDERQDIDDEDLTLVDWKNLNTSATGGLMDDNWNEVISERSGRRGCVKTTLGQRRFANHLLAEITNGESGDDRIDEEESSDYNELINIIGSSSSNRNSVENVERLLCDDDDENILDQFGGTLKNDDNSYLASSGGAADMMWCGGESAWTPDSDLGGLLIFGPN